LGYLGYEADEGLEVVGELYEVLGLYRKFFLLSEKLIDETREGGEVTGKYDKPKIPCLRVVEAGKVEEGVKEQLKEGYDQINPAGLKRRIERL